MAACGDDDRNVSARGEDTTTSAPESTAPASTAAPSTDAPTAPGFRAIEYGGLRFEVPDDWPVYDLAQEPTRCVRFDQHAVYLGHAGPDQDCPAQLIGRTDAIQIEPIDATSETTATRATTSSVVNELPVRQDPSSSVTRSLVVAFDSAGVVATITFSDDDALAQQILHTFGPATP